MTDQEISELTEIQVSRLMALKKDLEGPHKATFLEIWGEEQVNKYKEIIKKLVEIKKLENKHARGEEGRFLDISEINVEGF